MARGRNAHATWAELGAATRLGQLDRERAAILKAFPHLKGKGHATSAPIFERPKRTISAAARKAMSAGMRKFWARRKALDKKPK